MKLKTSLSLYFFGLFSVRLFPSQSIFASYGTIIDRSCSRSRCCSCRRRFNFMEVGEGCRHTHMHTHTRLWEVSWKNTVETNYLFRLKFGESKKQGKKGGLQLNKILTDNQKNFCHRSFTPFPIFSPLLLTIQQIMHVCVTAGSPSPGLASWGHRDTAGVAHAASPTPRSVGYLLQVLHKLGQPPFRRRVIL